MTPRKFGTWGAKAIAAIKRLPSTLTDRSITVPMRRKLKTEKRPRYRDYDREEFKHLRSKALRWANDSERSLPDDPPVPDALDDRSADNWRPLIAIANLAGGDWPEAARKAALALSGVGDDTEGVRLLRDIKWIFSGKPAKAEGTEEAVIEEEPVDRMFSIDLVGHLIGIEGSPWADWPKKGFTQTALADLLEPYGTRPATVRIGTKTLKGYMLASFREAFDAYLGEAEPVPPPPGGNLAVTPSQPNKDGANSQTLAVTQKNPVTADKLQKPATNGHCYGVTGKSTPEALSEALVTPVGEIAANGFGISSSPEERKPLEPGQVCCRVRIREIRHPKISCGPTDSLDDFVAL
jgi:hypothetical protein